ncbi:MAG: response regulator [Burkholderiales bacterium]
MIPKRVLVVDDHPVNRLVVKLILDPAGHLVVLAESGEEALERLAEGKFDAVLLDISMPGMSGEATYRRIRENPTCAGVRIIAYTAHALDSQRLELLDQGFDEVLTKPISRQSLFAALGIAE